jgi:Cu/Ag efflux protein CusF
VVFSLIADQRTPSYWVQTSLVIAAIAALGTASPGSAFTLNFESQAGDLGTIPQMGATAPAPGAEGSRRSDVAHGESSSEEGFSMQALRRGEVWAAVNVITFVHDAMEEIDMLRMPMDFSAGDDNQFSTSTFQGSSAQAAQASARPGDTLRTDMRMRTTRINTSSTSDISDASRVARRESEKREHRLETRDAVLGRQLQMDAKAAAGSSAEDASAVKAGFDSTHNELGYARQYNEIASDSDNNSESGSLLVKLSLCLLVMVLLERGLRKLLATKVS